jgi:hypothetical protein
MRKFGIHRRTGTLAKHRVLPRQVDITRYVRGAKAAAGEVKAVLVRPDGTVEITLKASESMDFPGPDPDDLLQ